MSHLETATLGIENGRAINVPTSGVEGSTDPGEILKILLGRGWTPLPFPSEKAAVDAAGKASKAWGEAAQGSQKMNPLQAIIQFLMQGGIGNAAYKAIPHAETAPGLRPQSDQALQQLIMALKGGGSGATAVQSGLRSPGTTEVNYGDPGMMTPLRLLSSLQATLRGAAQAGTTNKTSRGSEINLNPSGAAKLGADIPTNILPHELIHALRFNKGMDTGNRNVEESLGRMGANQPLNSYLYRQFGSGGEAPMTLEDQQRLQQMLMETLSVPAVSSQTQPR